MKNLVNSIIILPTYLVVIFIDGSLVIWRLLTHYYGLLELGEFVILTASIVIMLLPSLWYFAIVIGLNDILGERKINIYIFLVALIMFVISFLIPYWLTPLFGDNDFTYYLLNDSKGENIPIIIGFLAMFYVAFIAAKVVVFAESTEKPFRLKILYMSMLFIFYYIGIFFIHPKVSKIYRAQIKSAG